MKEYIKIISEYSKQIHALKLYVEKLSKILQKDQDNMLIDNSGDSHYIIQLALQLSRMFESYSTNKTEFVNLVKRLNEKVKYTFPDEILTNPDKAMDYFVRKYSTDKFKFQIENDRLSFQPLDTSTNRKFVKELNELIMMQSQYTMFLRSSLIQLINIFEYFLFQIIQLICKEHPERIDIDSVTLSYPAIKSYSAIGDLIDEMIEKKIEEINALNLIDLIKFFNKALNCSVTITKPNKDSIIEIQQRRHLAVHSDMIVSSKYIKFVKQELRKDIKKGDTLEVNLDYLNDSIEKILLFGLTLSCELMPVLLITKEERQDFFECIHDIGFKYLELENYKLSVELFSALRSKSDYFIDASKLQLNINYLQSLKWFGEVDEMHKELKKLDFSLCEDVHLLCKNLLEDNMDQALEILKKLSKDNTDDSYGIYEWPIMKELKKQPSFIEYYESRFKSDDKSQMS